MKVSRALELLNRLRIPLITATDHAHLEALTLGIEALKRHRDKDYITYNGMHEPLPGETLEVNDEHTKSH